MLLKKKSQEAKFLVGSLDQEAGEQVF